MTCLKFYRFKLRGFHSLESLGESAHGHLAYLILARSLIDSGREEEFLCFVKENILKDFDKQDWSAPLVGEPSGEAMILEIAKRIQKRPDLDIKKVLIQETKKNSFLLELGQDQNS